MGFNRREFLVSAALAGMATNLKAKGHSGFLAFSTLGCPKWNWKQILDFASSHGFAAIELRGLMGELDLPSLPEFAPDKIIDRRRELADHNLEIACVSSSAELHHADASRAQQSADARRFIDLAESLGSPYVRVFGNKLENPREETIKRVAAGLAELAQYAESRHITVLLESHGDFTDSATLKKVLTRANSAHAALLWDAHHTFVDGHEDPEVTWHELAPWIRHTHLKDSRIVNGERNYVLTGRGDVPVKRQIELLLRGGYSGYFCFEWEKLWHPELEEPEIAFADYARVAGSYVQERHGVLERLGELYENTVDNNRLFNSVPQEHS
jgi:sugar phosphate isomerase/epimerase